MIAALLLAAGASAAPVELSTGAAYWSKTYAIPATYTRYSIAFDSPAPERLGRSAHLLLERLGGVRVEPPRSIRAQGNESGYWPQPSQSLWKLPASNAFAAAAALRRLPGLYHYEKEGGVPEYPELYEKRAGLWKEIERLGRTLDDLPAARGLLEVEMTTLERLIYAHERAQRDGYILLTVDDARRTPPVFLNLGLGPLVAESSLYTVDDPRAAVVRLSSSPTESWQEWIRDSPSSCGPPGLRLMVVSFPDRAAGVDIVRKETDRHGGRVIEPACRSLNLPEMDRYVMNSAIFLEFGSDENLHKFARRVQDAGELVHWDAGNAAAFRSAETRRVALRRDLDAPSLRPDVPLIRGLLAAEIERLSPYADAYEDSLKRPAIEVIPVSPR